MTYGNLDSRTSSHVRFLPGHNFLICPDVDVPVLLPNFSRVHESKAREKMTPDAPSSFSISNIFGKEVTDGGSSVVDGGDEHVSKRCSPTRKSSGEANDCLSPLDVAWIVDHFTVSDLVDDSR